MKQLDVNDYSFGHLTLIMLLHYLVKCKSRSLAVYNKEFILASNGNKNFKVIQNPGFLLDQAQN